MAGAKLRGRVGALEHVEVSLLLRRRSDAAFGRLLSQLHEGRANGARLTRAQYAQRHSADPEHLEAIRHFAATHGLTVEQQHGARRTVVLSGTAARFEDAFGIQLLQYDHPDGSYRGYTGPLQLPAELQDIVVAVLGLDDRPQAKPHFRVRDDSAARRKNPSDATFTPLQVASLYGFPPGDGAGQTIALIELGGGYSTEDLGTYFSGLGMASTPAVSAVSVDGASNAPTGEANGPDGEVLLDIEVAGAVAPAASIMVLFAPNTDAGFLDAIMSAIHEAPQVPNVISISWGGPESGWSQQALTGFDQAFQEAAALGITVTVAAGDSGSGDGLSGDNVDFPASSPHVLACGGTRLQAGGSTISAETVWNDGAEGGATGGGVSTIFPVPSWQSGLASTSPGGAASPLAHRGVPDVAGDADPLTGYEVRVDGHDLVVGGTSAVAPLWAGLLARINASKGASAGFVNATLYANANALRDITQGNNGDFAATRGWDACTGLGSPIGGAVRAALAD
jgi:kumamolisin